MFRHLDANKLSTEHQSASVLFYPGATAGEILKRLRNDEHFLHIDPLNVGKIFVLCGTNDVDKILGVNRAQQQDFITTRDCSVNDNKLNCTKNDITNLINFLHEWVDSATINVINILPRFSKVRNIVINQLNEYLLELGEKNEFVNNIRFDLDRFLFSTKEGYRKSEHFLPSGTDNVHLNDLGIVKLGAHLKFWAHNDEDGDN